MCNLNIWWNGNQFLQYICSMFNSDPLLVLRFIKYFAVYIHSLVNKACNSLHIKDPYLLLMLCTNQNLHWKLGQQTPSLGIFRDYGLKNIFFRNKTFLFFTIESWNFQVQFEIEFRETSQNFNSIRQPMKITIVWIS